jgi:hypothetical protein
VDRKTATGAELNPCRFIYTLLAEKTFPDIVLEAFEAELPEIGTVCEIHFIKQSAALNAVLCASVKKIETDEMEFPEQPCYNTVSLFERRNTPCHSHRQSCRSFETLTRMD